MTIQGSVPAANRGVVDVGSKVPGTGVGIFEDTVVNGKSYSTVLTFKNFPATITKGAAAGFLGIEAYDFGPALMLLKGVNVALTATELDVNLVSNFTVAVGTVTGTDANPPGANEKNVAVQQTPVATGTYATIGKVLALNTRTVVGASTAVGGSQVIDGTSAATKFFVNLNLPVANITATSKVVLNGTVEFHYDDCGSDLAVGV